MNKAELQAEVAKIHWFHDYEIVAGVRTHGTSPMAERAPYFQIPQDLSGKRVLDIGCADGYFTFLAESRGASVVSIDSWPRRGFFLAHQVRQSKAEFHHMNVYDLQPDTFGLFDIVFFFGVYYHLKNPLLALERIAGITREYAIVESQIMEPRQPEGEGLSRFLERDELMNDPTNWWVPNVPCLLQTVRAAGFPRAELVACYEPNRGIVRAYKGPRTVGRSLTEDFFIAIDTPVANARVSGSVLVSGWAISQLDPPDGVEKLVVYLDRLDDPSCELGVADYGHWRADLPTHFGDAYGRSGFEFKWDAAGVPRGRHTLHVMAVGKRGWHYRSVPILVE